MNKDIVSVEQAELIEIVKAAVGAGEGVRITVVGSSMYPFLRNGTDSVVLTSPDSIKCGDVLFYVRADGHCVLHRCIKIKNGEYIMCGDNQTSLEHGIYRDGIIAVSSKFYRKNRVVTDKTAWYRLYRFLWCTLFPLRPVMCVILKMIMRIRRIFKRGNNEQG